MKDTQILSAFEDTPSAAPAVASARPLLFDACHVGVVLRAVGFVEMVAAVAAMFRSEGLVGWLADFSLLSGAMLPAALVWLLTLCGLKRWLGVWPLQAQQGAGVLMGAVAGLYGCGLLYFSGLLGQPAWLASASAGALMAALVVVALVLRTRARTPADTAARLAELQSRIRPHFLFNTLNSAIALVRAEPARAESLLEDLSELFRHALTDAVALGTLGEEVALAERYLHIEQVRFGDRLQLQWSLDPAAQAVRVPVLLLQPLVENAVRHGVEPAADGGWVKISTERRGDWVRVQVSNSVPAAPLVPPRTGHGIGLRNVRDRLGLMHDIQGRFSAGLAAGVYRVRMEFPIHPL